MITLTKAELDWIINAVSVAESESRDLAEDPALSSAAQAICLLNADNLRAVENKLIKAKNTGAKRIAIRR